MTDRTELELLREFADRRTEACFNELVRRYLDLVYSAGLRLLADAHLAEDVSQSVFAALAQQAGSVAQKLERGATLSGWLHLTTRNLAAKTIRTEVRRRAREQEALAMHEPLDERSTEAWDQLAPHLDHALGELAEADRDAILLRFFERKSAREIGRAFGVSEEAAQKRISRALDRLRDRCLARGAALPGTAGASGLAGLLSAKSIEAAPLAFSAGLAQAALVASAGTPISAGAGSGLLSALLMTKTQFAILTAALVAASVPIVSLRSELSQLRDSVEFAPPPDASAATALIPSLPPPSARESVNDELARLRREAAELRGTLAARAAASQGQPSRELPPSHLASGRPVGINELRFAGNATPAAALESLLAFRRDGDVSGATSLMLVAPERMDKWNELLASSESRQRLAAEMMAATAGAVMQSVVRVDSNGVASAPEESLKLPEPNTVATAEITETERIAPRRVQFTLQIVRGSDTNVEHLAFGLTPRGWKGIE